MKHKISCATNTPAWKGKRPSCTCSPQDGVAMMEMPEKDWEVEFDKGCETKERGGTERFANYYGETDWQPIINQDEIKSFIRSLLTRAREDGYDEGAHKASMCCNEKTVPMAVELERERIKKVIKDWGKEWYEVSSEKLFNQVIDSL